MRKQRNMFQTEEQEETSEKELKEMKIRNLPDKELKVIILNMFTELRRKMEEHTENLNKEVKKEPIRALKYNN